MNVLSRPARPIAVVMMLVALTACGSNADDATKTASGDQPTSAAADKAPTIPEDVCTAFTADELGTVVGATVTTETQPGGGCGFEQDDPRAVSGSIGAIPDDSGTGGFEAAKSGASGAMDSPKVIEIDGIGTKAFLAFGTVFGGESLQVSGGTTDGKVIALVAIQQSEGLDRSALEDLGRKLLTLADDKLH
jgi:hypothetical protein